MGIVTVHPSSFVCRVGMDYFNFFEKRSFRYENDDEKSKNGTIVLQKKSFLKNGSFKKDHF